MNSIEISPNFGHLDDLGLMLKMYVEVNHDWVPAAVLSVFAILNFVRVIAYIPQIAKAARDNNGASAISCTTWLLFLFSHLTTISYSLVCLGDVLLALIFLGNAAACVGILAVTYHKRRAFRRISLLSVTDESRTLVST